MLNSTTYLNWTPSIEWFVVRCGSTNEHLKDMCSWAIGLQAQNMLISLGSIVNINGGGGGLIWAPDEHKNLHLRNYQ